MVVICHSKKFVFIKTQKTGGTALELALNNYLDQSDIATPINPPEIGHNPYNHLNYPTLKGHSSVSKVLNLFGPAIQHYVFWAVERHPVDKCLSDFAYKNSMNEQSKNKLISWNEYIKLQKFPISTELLGQPSGKLKYMMNVILEYDDLNIQLPFFLDKYFGIKNFDFSRRAKSGFRGIYGEPESKNLVLPDDYKVIMNLFSRSNEILRRYGINYC